MTKLDAFQQRSCVERLLITGILVMLALFFFSVSSLSAMATRKDVPEKEGQDTEGVQVNYTEIETAKQLPSQMQPGRQPFEQEVEKAEELEAQGLERR